MMLLRQLQSLRMQLSQQHKHGATPDNVCCIYATAPFVQAKDINRGLSQLLNSGSDFAFSVTSYAFPSNVPSELLKNISGNVSARALQYPLKILMRHGMIPVSSIGEKLWHGWKKKCCSAVATPVILPRHRVQDIDTPRRLGTS